ncbi:MAG: nucleotidyltransferase family protein [Methanoregula sp.]|nr:nucleotidyltransferase family protein [Methanoregula sp.]
MKDGKKPAPSQLTSYEYSDEINLVLTCAKGSVNNNNRETITTLLRKELNWDFIYRQAERHKLIPVLYYNLKASAPEMVPEHILSRMSGIYLLSMKRSIIQISELLKVIQLGKEHEIPFISYKGAVLSQQIYGDIGLRISSDIDIIVRQHDVIRAKALLISQGYTPRVSLTPEQDKKFIQVRCEYDLSHSRRSTLDLHWQFIPYYYLAPFEETVIWSGLKVISLEGRDIYALSPEMLIVALCIHGAKHQWKELRQICDIAGIISSEKEIDWGLVLTIAREKRIERIVFLGLRLVEELMKPDLPPFVSEAIRHDRVVQTMVPSSIDTLFTDEENHGGDIQEALYWVSVRECIWDKVRVISLLAFKPNHDDWAYISLPGVLSPLYYVIRPVRLAFEYGVKR